MKLFLDCEFIQLSTQAKLISLALVAEDGHEFYVEFLDTWRPEDCSDFVIEIVLPQLWAGAYAMPIIDAREALLQYLGSFHQTLEVVTDAPEYDWMLFCELAHSEGRWPQNLLTPPPMP
ncbi:3'-5' exoribonuclease [Pseudomonas fluorescens]|nr:3'-5' exoribonuclease [Pseudomonas fluorescens]